ncbi:MAG TPA: ferrous iron transport protein B [Aggregatilinea sp.]|uniref:ferrous iron transport protein B n=1 Tax=Aggregatilinea sp. TaxID=2806333 RepID=UPI002B9309DD|nr:ferrous iron transport protein B [Aggregatilinea sp.]HML22407.1 ferrous iron transport protein B [Aggregatilinea sp.]
MTTLELQTRSRLFDYGPELEPEIVVLQAAIEASPTLSSDYAPRWLAVTLLEGDADLAARIASAPGGLVVLDTVEQIAARVAATCGEDVDTLIADRRYAFISGLVGQAVTRPADGGVTRSDKLDQVATHPWLGVPIFLILMWVVFQMTANVSSYYVDWIDGVIAGPVSNWALALLGTLGLSGTWAESLLVDGVIAGAGGMLVFVPVLLFLYFFLAVLEDSGYMARAAFVMDRFMQRLGLQGKSFIPLLVGFGCSVPGIYATRTLEDRRDRILTGMLVPFMSCAARLPVYILIGTAFFGASSGNLVFAMYLIGIAAAVMTGFLLRNTVLKSNEPQFFVMELPPYRRPSMKTVLRQVRMRTGAFVQAVWTVLMAASIIVWVLLNVPYHNGQPPELEDSLFGGVSRTVAPAFKPAGFGTWESSGALVTGLLAKEVVVSTLGQIYATAADNSDDATGSTAFVDDAKDIVVGFGTATLDTVKATISLIPGVNLMGADAEEEDTALETALRDHFTPLTAVAFSIFVLLYTPCMAAIAAFRHEFGSRWMWANIGYMLVVAWLAATLTYQVGSLLGLG